MLMRRACSLQPSMLPSLLAACHKPIHFDLQPLTYHAPPTMAARRARLDAPTPAAWAAAALKQIGRETSFTPYWFHGLQVRPLRSYCMVCLCHRRAVAPALWRCHATCMLLHMLGVFAPAALQDATSLAPQPVHSRPHLLPDREGASHLSPPTFHPRSKR